MLDLNDRRCDLHLHTNFSDGLLRPDTVVRKAREVELAAIAISDHDAVGGIDIAVTTGHLVGVEVVPAIEMSCIYEKTDIHMLAYYMDYHDPELLTFLHKVQHAREDRAQKIVGKLNEQGVPLDVERVMAIAHGAALGRPHIAQALVERGHARNFDDAFNRFIGYHCSAYVPKMELSPLDAIATIKKYGGIPVAAHPGSYNKEELLNMLIASGLMGIEVYHPDHDKAKTEHYLEVAQKNHLFVTGGSDCHGGRKGRLFIGGVTVPYRNVMAMKEYKGLP
jgi:3',5'-nucleoside bisphosphate phosphatase